MSVFTLGVEEQCRWWRGGDIFKHTEAHLVELPCPMQAVGVKPSPSRFINRMVLMLIGERENENEIEKPILMSYVKLLAASPFIR